MYAQIQPVPAFGGPATVLVIDNVTVSPASSATLWWHLRASQTGPDLVPPAALTLEGDAYAAWGADDAYLYTFTANTLGIVIEQIVGDAAPLVDAPAAG